MSNSHKNCVSGTFFNHKNTSTSISTVNSVYSLCAYGLWEMNKSLTEIYATKAVHRYVKSVGKVQMIVKRKSAAQVKFCNFVPTNW